MLLQAFTRDALSSYLPGTQALVEKRAATWAERPEVRLVDETKRLALDAVAQDIMGISGGEDLDRLDRWYADIGGAFTGLPLPLPGTRYSRGLKALEQVLAFFGGVIRARREKPTSDGLSRSSPPARRPAPASPTTKRRASSTTWSSPGASSTRTS